MQPGPIDTDMNPASNGDFADAQTARTALGRYGKAEEVAAAVVLQCRLVEWCLLFFCMGLVLTAELFNTAVETLVRNLDTRTKERCGPALDIAAGAVLMASVTAAVIGSLVFLFRLCEFFGAPLSGW